MARRSLAYASYTGVALSENPEDPYSLSFPTHVKSPSTATMEAAEEPRWRERTVLGLAKILGLSAGWDSYGAPRIQTRAVNLALHLLESAARDDAPAPIVVPTSDGGVQLEWHAWGLDVELEVPPQETPQLLFRDRRSAQEWEREVGADLGPLSEVLKILAERAGQERGR